MRKATVAVHKFSSCDGCQLALLNMGENLLELSKWVDIRHFAEDGLIDPNATVDLAFVEGSITTAVEIERIKAIRDNSKMVITIGACATAGGIQALRNFADHQDWMSSIYADPGYIDSLTTSTAIAKHIKVDYELWGCPINSWQILTVIKHVLLGVTPLIKNDSLCIECKRQHHVCVLVAKGEPCMGPVTKTGCGALCPSAGRACYACYGPAENPNPGSLGQWLTGIGLKPQDVARRFHHINNQAESFEKAGNSFQGIPIKKEKS